MKLAFDTIAFDASLQAKKEQLVAAARPAAQAGVQVLYDAARVNVPVSKAAHMFYGSHSVYGPYRPGNLRDAIYQVFSKSESTPTKAVYHVSWNATKAPYGWMVELGTVHAPAHSFLGKALREQRREAADAMKQRYIQEVQGGA